MLAPVTFGEAMERLQRAVPARWHLRGITCHDLRRWEASLECAEGRRSVTAHLRAETVDALVDAVERLPLMAGAFMLPKRVDMDLTSDYDAYGEDAEAEIRDLARRIGADLPGGLP